MAVCHYAGSGNLTVSAQHSNKSIITDMSHKIMSRKKRTSYIYSQLGYPVRLPEKILSLMFVFSFEGTFHSEVVLHAAIQLAM